MRKVINYRNITLIPVQSVKCVSFKSALDKANFIVSHKDFEYELLDSNNALVYLFIVVDTHDCGFCLSPTRSLTYAECVTLIDLYL